jgi:hypothetical protein
MTFALTSASFFGSEIDEAITDKFYQYVHLKITAANTDVDFDLGDTTPGTFWDAVDGTAAGLNAFNAFKSMIPLMESFVSLTGKGIAQYAQASASYPSLMTLDSAASAGGGAAETLTVTGLLTTDSIRAISLRKQGANAEALTQYGTAGSGAASATNALPVAFTGDPGAGAIVRVAFTRTATAVASGTYQQTLNATTGLPEILYVTGNAPTAYDIMLTVILKSGTNPIKADF